MSAEKLTQHDEQRPTGCSSPPRSWPNVLAPQRDGSCAVRSREWDGGRKAGRELAATATGRTRSSAGPRNCRRRGGGLGWADEYELPHRRGGVGGVAHGGGGRVSNSNPNRRSYGTGQLYIKSGAYGRWSMDGRRVNRSSARCANRGSREGLTKRDAEAAMRRADASRPPQRLRPMSGYRWPSASAWWSGWS